MKSECVDVEKTRAVIIIFMVDNLICHNHRHRRDEHKKFFLCLCLVPHCVAHIYAFRYSTESLINDGNYNAWRIFNAAPDELLPLIK